MRIGLITPYEKSDITYIMLQVGNLCLDLGMEVSIFPVEKPSAVDPLFDKRVVKSSLGWNEWIATGFDTLIFAKAPVDVDYKELKNDAKIKIVGLAVWEILDKHDLNGFKDFDCIVCPTKACGKLLSLHHELDNITVIPWCPSCPITLSNRELDVHKIGILWSLQDSQASKTELKFISVANTLLENCKNAWLTILYPDRLPASNLKELQKLATYANGRCELMANVSTVGHTLMFGHHDLTLIPSIVENCGLLGLTSLAMSAPIMTYDIPAFGELIKNDKNGVLVECEIEENEIGVPFAVSNNLLFGKELISLLKSPDRLARMRMQATVGLRDKILEFKQKWKKLLLG